jgi:hypothetical protein
MICLAEEAACLQENYFHFRRKFLADKEIKNFSEGFFAKYPTESKNTYTLINACKYIYRKELENRRRWMSGKVERFDGIRFPISFNLPKLGDCHAILLQNR